MKRRDAKTVAALTRMFEASYDRAAVYMSQAHALRAKLDAAEARIAELQARPAAPSVEDVADALVAMHDGAIGPADALADVFPDFPMDRTEAIQAAYKRYFGEKDDGA